MRSDHDMLYAKGFEGQCGAEADRSGAEDEHLVGGLGPAAVDGVAGDRHGLVERRHLERDVGGDHFEVGPALRVGDEEVLGQCTPPAAVADDVAGRRHRIDDDVVADRQPRDLVARGDDLAGGFVPQRHPTRCGGSPPIAM
jgi:hypothetical protein